MSGGGGGGGDSGGTPGNGTNPGTGGGNGSGNSSSGVSNAATVLISNQYTQQQQQQQQQNCIKLNQLTDSTKTNIRPLIAQLRSKTAESIEYSVSFKKIGFPDLGEPTYENSGIMQGNSKTESTMYTDGYYGGIHTHVKGTYQMFSWLDLRTLDLLYDGALSYQKSDVFTMIVCDNGQVYSLVIDNPNLLSVAIQNDWNDPNLSGLSDKEKINRLQNKLGRKFSRDSNVERAFLKYFSNYGVSLYRATDTNVSNWEKLELDNPSSNNTSVKSTPCK